MTVIAPPDPNAEDIQLAQSVFQLWNQGSQEPAVDQLRPRADAGEPWAVGLMCWLRMQQGPAQLDAAMQYAKTAQQMGLPWSAVNVFNNVVGSVPQSPELLERAFELLIPGQFFQPGIDPVGQGWNLLAQGQPAAALRLMGLRWVAPASDPEWEALAQSAQLSLGEINRSLARIREQNGLVTQAADESRAAITKARTISRLPRNRLDCSSPKPTRTQSMRSSHKTQERTGQDP